MKKEQRLLAQTISKSNGGQVQFNLKQAAKITGISRFTLPDWLHHRGVMVFAGGRCKYVNVNDLAVAMTFGRSSPLE